MKFTGRGYPSVDVSSYYNQFCSADFADWKNALEQEAERMGHLDDDTFKKLSERLAKCAEKPGLVDMMARYIHLTDHQCETLTRITAQPKIEIFEGHGLTEREKWLMVRAYKAGACTRFLDDESSLEMLTHWISIETGEGATIESYLANNAPK